MVTISYLLLLNYVFTEKVKTCFSNRLILCALLIPLERDR